MQVTQTLRKAAQVGSDRPLTIFGNRTRTAGEVVDRVRRAAAVLTELGVAPGDRVGILALNSDRYFELLFATPWAGAVVNPVNVRWSVEEIGYSLVDCDTGSSSSTTRSPRWSMPCVGVCPTSVPSCSSARTTHPSES